jgi:hypothetical protein
VSGSDRVLLAIDAGTATTSVAVLGRPTDRWRLLAALAVPAPVDPGAVAEVAIARLADADPELAALLGLGSDALPTLTARSHPPRGLAVLGASRRAAALLAGVAARTPWRATVASPESHDPREMTELALRPDVDAILLGAGEPPGPDERGALDDLIGLVGAVARRRPEVRVVLSGPITTRKAWAEAVGDALTSDDPRLAIAPAIGRRTGADEAVRDVLDGLLDPVSEPRAASIRAVTSLADALDRRIELIEVGFDGGLRAVAVPGVGSVGPTCTAVRTAVAGLVPPDVDDPIVEDVLAWTTGSLDKHRMGDRLRDLRRRPWADAGGDGAHLRLASARAALRRLVQATPDLADLPTPDLTVVAGGAFQVAPPAATVLALADIVRRPGATQVAFDHARLLGPIGTLEDPDERRALLADVADDLLVPLGASLILAGGGIGRSWGSAAGRLRIERAGHEESHDLMGGELSFLGLPPGQQANATVETREPMAIGPRSRRLTVTVGGGLAGLLVDLRDIPLRLPERRDRRRAALAEWSALAWPEDAG